MTRFTLLVAFAVGLVCLLDHSRAVPLSSGASKIAGVPQIPNFPGPGEIPKPPGMLHSRVTRNVPHEIPGQDQFPPPPPPPATQMPSTRARRDVRDLVEADNSLPSFKTIRSSWHKGCRGKRSAKGTGGKLPRKTG